MKAPEVSVVMSVFNGGAALKKTLASVLDQQGCTLEFVVIDDGSTDESARVLDECARIDPRLQVFHQENTGLTRALMVGCSRAVGEFIARQDAGDISLPGRLARQVARLRNDRACVAVSCHTDFVTSLDEFLYRAAKSEEMLNQALAVSDRAPLGPSHHGSVLMRAETYRLVGGYRAPFYFAQDLDLWSRLAEHGRFGVLDEVLYKAKLDPESISGTMSLEQRQLAAMVRQLSIARRAGESEEQLLAAAARVPRNTKPDKSRRLARGNYFIGSCLSKRAPGAAERYFENAIRLDPAHWRARLRLLLAKAGL
jgi:glycosyltransferase involved in cell wall biosynthesis